MPFVNAGGVQVNFPFEPYECQLNYMQKLITCLQQVCCIAIVNMNFMSTRRITRVQGSEHLANKHHKIDSMV